MIVIAILFLILIAVGLYFYSTLNNKLYDQKKQILMLQHENDNLRYKLKNFNHKNPKSIIIKYTAPIYNSGITIRQCNVYLAPIDTNSNIINSLKQNTRVLIQDSAIIDNIKWFRVYFNSESETNNKGWIPESNVKASNI
ncbi:hypothetical protein D4Z93_12605 [Clostridium fermenticellae]|uniref:SH3 domain-containing protein n=1 Tax=Clostridium fermenticellae TaxID=2068654 RepID=A0A386H6F5_9CLOT|nr:hypothetical protein [Clostridium fermenticellae]AYD41299.1 hypothetical protein D4Z93_12605 [Clostridium fermenticellae]